MNQQAPVYDKDAIKKAVQHSGITTQQAEKFVAALADEEKKNPRPVIHLKGIFC